MSQTVERLKELLFDSEAQALTELARRIDGVADTTAKSRDDLVRRIDGVADTTAKSRDDLVRRIDGVADADTRGRELLKQKLEEVYARAGDTERMTASVAEILGEALRRAEVLKHSELSQTIAPLVVTTIKTELRNSQDEMVEALYPITGRLVASYVASAIKDLTDQMNRRLEKNPLMLRLQSLATGRSVGELALAGTQDFQMKELYLIRRGSGELVAHWPDNPVSGRDHAMSGVLAAVNEFANEAFSADQTSLRHIDLGGEEVYLRGSPIYLLAARCSGQAPKRIEQTLDEAFLSAVEIQHRLDTEPRSPRDPLPNKSAALADLGTRLTDQLTTDLEELNQPAGSGMLKTMLALILLPLLGWLAWGYYSDYRTNSVHATAQRVIAADAAMLGYPAQIDVGDRGRSVSISGLTPSQAAKTRIISELQRALPSVTLRDRLSVVPGSGITIPDVTPELARVRSEIATAVSNVARGVLLRTSSRAEQRLKQAAGDLALASSVAADANQAQALKRHESEVQSILAESKLEAAAMETSAFTSNDNRSAETYQALSARLDALASELVRLGGADKLTLPPAKPIASPPSDSLPLDTSMEEFAASAERVAALATTVTVAKSMRPPAPAPLAVPAVVPPPTQSTPREKLEAFTRSHAVFFANNLDYRNPELANRRLSELALLMKSAGILIRVVGYTDEVGVQNRNVQLAQDRASKIRSDLISLGVPASQIVTVGRSGANDLSDARGALSPNRRVQFEIGFDGEAQQ